MAFLCPGLLAWLASALCGVGLDFSFSLYSMSGQIRPLEQPWNLRFASLEKMRMGWF